MARPLVVPPHLPVAELGRRYRGARDPVLRSHLQIVWLLAGGAPTAEVARATGYHPNWIREVAERYRAGGPGALGDRRRGDPGGAPLPTPEQAEGLRAALAGPPADGGPWTGRKVAAWMAAALGRPVAPQRGWGQLRRLGMTPPRPRPREERADPAARAACKQGGSRPRSTPWRPTRGRR